MQISQSQKTFKYLLAIFHFSACIQSPGFNNCPKIEINWSKDIHTDSNGLQQSIDSKVILWEVKTNLFVYRKIYVHELFVLVIPRIDCSVTKLALLMETQWVLLDVEHGPYNSNTS